MGLHAQEKKMGMAVGRTGATFLLYPETAARLPHLARSRQEAGLAHGYKRVKYGEGGGKGK